MFCPECGSMIKDTAKFCPGCGCAVQSGSHEQSQPAYAPMFTVDPQSRQVSEHIALGEDGKYRWVYEYSLFRHPGLFLLIWKIFFFIMVGIFGFMLIITAVQGDMDGERALDTLKYFGYFLIGMTALVGISYLIYAAIMGGKYIVVFEMDDKGINHQQIDRQARKANKLAEATFWIGALAGSRGAMLSGANMSTSMYTAFNSAGRVRLYPRKNLIKIRETLSHNQIFVYPEDYHFVVNYILARVPEKAKSKLH